jgi:hypothetical protein
MKVATFFLAPIWALLPTCNKKVVITHTGYGGNHKLAKWGSRDRHFGTHSSYDLKDDQVMALIFFFCHNSTFGQLVLFVFSDLDFGV